ncbi:MAG: hypothetical protein M1838_001155 [Thelocarpon superellum]|nr:MAG: hypothetical protein M1838_001155 [Thelocarpon superellum]
MLETGQVPQPARGVEPAEPAAPSGKSAKYNPHRIPNHQQLSESCPPPLALPSFVDPPHETEVTGQDVGGWVHEQALLAARNAFLKNQASQTAEETSSQPAQATHAKLGAPRFGVTVNTSLPPSTRLPSRPKARPMGDEPSQPKRATKPSMSPRLALPVVAAPETPGTRSDPLPPPQTTSEGRHVPVRPAITIPDDLSPEDRRIFIGLSVSAATPIDSILLTAVTSSSHQDSPEARRSRGKAEDSADNPTILVTPAQETGTWSPLDDRHQPVGRARPSSSWYSRWSPPAFGGTADDAPPLPAFARQPHASNAVSKPRLTRDSSGTLFEEDFSPNVQSSRASAAIFPQVGDSPSRSARGRSFSLTSRLPASDRSSVEIQSPRHPSRGWWNYILSPSLSRSDTDLAIRESPVESASLRQLGISATDTAVPPANAWSEKEVVSLPPRTTSAAPPRPSEATVLQASGCAPQTVSRGVAGSSLPSDEFFQPVDGARSDNPLFPLEAKVLPPIPATQLSRVVEVEEWMENIGKGDTSALADEQADSRKAAAPAIVQRHGRNSCDNDERIGSKPLQETMTRSRNPGQGPRAESGPAPNFSGVNIRGVKVFGLPSSPAPTPRGQTETTHGSVKTSQETPSTGPPPYSPPRNDFQATQGHVPFVAYVPAEHAARIAAGGLPTPFPAPTPPGIPRAMPLERAAPTPEPSGSPAPSYALRRYLTEPATCDSSPGDLLAHLHAMERKDAKRQVEEKEHVYPRKVGKVSLLRKWFGPNGFWRKEGLDARNKRLWFVGLTSALVLMIIIILTAVLASTQSSHAPAPAPSSQFLNLTNWPPVPTGISTVAQPDAVVEDTGCVFPATMWSCAMPKEMQASIAPNNPDQPNFKIEIIFRNDSTTNSSGLRAVSTNVARGLSPGVAASAGSLIQRRLLQLRGAASNAAWTPSPAPPSLEDQIFMGNTTDNVTSSPKQGEQSPFYITFLGTTSPASTPKSKHKKRDNTGNSGSNASDPFPDIAATIPPPALNEDGSPQAATLLPLPVLQPLHLYDRGLPSEHYGFYTYFDRSIFLQSTTPLNASDTAAENSASAADLDGGSPLQDAKVQCTWAQTRFLVQIWTAKPASAFPLLSNDTSTFTITNSSTTFARPGSFPYPVTFTSDRHGGDVTKKMVYCYGLDGGTANTPPLVNTSDKKIQVENRGFGGILVGGGQGPLGQDHVTLAQGGLGGIDGGTGGCSCQWKNFVDS